MHQYLWQKILVIYLTQSSNMSTSFLLTKTFEVKAYNSDYVPLYQILLLISYWPYLPMCIFTYAKFFF